MNIGEIFMILVKIGEILMIFCENQQILHAFGEISVKIGKIPLILVKFY